MAISVIYILGGAAETRGREARVASPPQAIKKRYSSDTALIQSQLLILDHFWMYIMGGMELEVMVR